MIVDDHLFIAKALAEWLARQPDCTVLGCAGSGKEAWDLCARTRPKLALLDIVMPDCDGLDLAQRLLETLPETRLLAMSFMSNPYTMWRVAQSGIHGFVDKSESPESFLNAIHVVANQGTYFSPVFHQVVEEWLSQPEAFYKVLSDREQAILRRLESGTDDESISRELGIALATVATHRRNIRWKLNLHSDRDLIAYAHKWGISSHPH